MASASFTRDEVILALDVLYSSEKGRVFADSEEMGELSALLNRLPIHPVMGRRADFRNPHGVTNQINLFRTAMRTGNRSSNLGIKFIEIAMEFEGRHDELHEIAQAIRRNEECFSLEYGSICEDIGFPEGVLLGHLHRTVEIRDGSKVQLADHCEICNMKPDLYYQASGSLLQNHLVTPPTMLEGKKKYRADQFITVCPTCHAALHRIRPWKSKLNYGEILR